MLGHGGTDGVLGTIVIESAMTALAERFGVSVSALTAAGDPR